MRDVGYCEDERTAAALDEIRKESDEFRSRSEVIRQATHEFVQRHESASRRYSHHDPIQPLQPVYLELEGRDAHVVATMARRLAQMIEINDGDMALAEKYRELATEIACQMQEQGAADARAFHTAPVGGDP